MTAEKNAVDSHRESEDSRRLFERIESIGQLTGGIVHDLNNSLQSIVAALELVRKLIAAGRGSETERFIANAIGSAHRAAALNDRLLSFSSRRSTQPEAISLNEVIAGMEDIVRRSLPHSIKLVVDLAKDLWESYCDAEQAEVAVLNLILHARDAVPNGGMITIHTYNTDMSSDAAEYATNLPPGKYVCLSIAHVPSDITAAAMQEVSRQRNAESRGLESERRFTLAAEFARRNAGAAEMDSEIGGGTSVVVYLPRYNCEK